MWGAGLETFMTIWRLMDGRAAIVGLISFPGFCKWRETGTLGLI